MNVEKKDGITNGHKKTEDKVSGFLKDTVRPTLMVMRAEKMVHETQRFGKMRAVMAVSRANLLDDIEKGTNHRTAP